MTDTVIPDPRIEQVVHFTAGRAVMLPGQHGSPIGQRVQRLKAAVVEHARRAADLRASSSRMLDSEVEERRRGFDAALAKAAEEEAKALIDARHAHYLAMHAVTVVKPGKDVSFYDALIDVELRREFKAQDPSKQAQQVARMLDDPLPHLRTIEALVRAPSEVSGLPPGVGRALQTKLYAQLQPEGFRSLDEQAAQINAAQRAVGITLEALSHGTVNVPRDMPNAHALVFDPDLAPLKWWPAEVDERYAPVAEEGA